jgi:phosphoglycolate phosphatase
MPLKDAVIVFDLDGTLVDTAPDLIGALNAVLEEEGLPAVPADSARRLVGRGAATMFQRSFALAQAPWEDARETALIERFVEVYFTRLTRESRTFPGVEAALDALQAQGARFAVCTNKRTDLSIALLEALGLARRFEAIVGADLAPRKKPDPSHLLAALDAAAGRPERALMVGDSEADIGAAKAAGVRSLAVSFGYCNGPVEALGADAIIHDFEELAGAAARLLATPC